MMFLTQLVLNRMDRFTIKTLGDIYRLHRLVMKGFTEYSEAERVLFRVEPEHQNRGTPILIQSTQPPNYQDLSENGPGILSARTKEFPINFRSGQNFRFRLRANPTVTRNGKRLGLIRDDSLIGWLERKKGEIGLQFRSLSVIDEGYLVGIKEKAKNRHRLNLKTVRFEGIIEVIDTEKFISAFISGIGPGKAFGCGLLSIARI